MKSKTVLQALAALAIPTAVFLLIATDAERPVRESTQAFMREKLVFSQSVLEGLALEKFDLVSKNAIRLRHMTQSNGWFICQQPDYMKHTAEYQKSTDALYLAAVDKNLEACTEAWVRVTRQCVECHRIVRREQHGKAVRSAEP